MQKSSAVTIFAVFLLSQPCFAEPREFKDTTGRTIKAELLAVRDDQVQLKLEGGKEYRLPLDRFCEADVTYIKEWAVKNPAPITIRGLYIEFDKTVDKMPAEKPTADEKKKGKVVPTNYTTDYTIQIKNNSDKDLEGLKVKYTIYKQVRNRILGQGGSSSEKLVELTGDEAIEFLPKASAHEISTVTAPTSSWEKGGKKQEPKEMHDETLWGVVARVFVGESEVRADSYPDGVINRVEAYKAKKEAD